MAWQKVCNLKFQPLYALNLKINVTYLYKSQFFIIFTKIFNNIA